MSQIRLAYARIDRIQGRLTNKGNRIYRFRLTLHSTEDDTILEVRGLGYDPATQNFLASVTRRNYPVAFLCKRFEALRPLLEKVITEHQKALAQEQVVLTDIVCWGERSSGNSGNSGTSTSEGTFIPKGGSVSY